MTLANIAAKEDVDLWKICVMLDLEGFSLFLLLLVVMLSVNLPFGPNEPRCSSSEGMEDVLLADDSDVL